MTDDESYTRADLKKHERDGIKTGITFGVIGAVVAGFAGYMFGASQSPETVNKSVEQVALYNDFKMTKIEIVCSAASSDDINAETVKIPGNATYDPKNKTYTVAPESVPDFKTFRDYLTRGDCQAASRPAAAPIAANASRHKIP